MELTPVTATGVWGTVDVL